MKTSVKKIFALFFAIILSAVIAACDYFPNPPEVPPTPSDWGLVESEAEASVSLPDEPASDDLDGREDGRLVTGIIIYYDGSTLMLCTPDDRNLSFLVTDDVVDNSEANGLLVGSEVDVSYIGVIEENNTSAAQVTKLSQSQKQAEISADLNVTGGIIIEYESDIMSIATLDGDERTFLIADGKTDITKAKELAADDYVTVFYEHGNNDTLVATKLVK